MEEAIDHVSILQLNQVTQIDFLWRICLSLLTPWLNVWVGGSASVNEALRQRSWVRSEETTRISSKIKVDNLILLGIPTIFSLWYNHLWFAIAREYLIFTFYEVLIRFYPPNQRLFHLWVPASFPCWTCGSRQKHGLNSKLIPQSDSTTYLALLRRVPTIRIRYQTFTVEWVERTR